MRVRVGRSKQRKGLAVLRDRLESGDVLVVTKLDRLGRTAMDVRATVEDLEQAGVRVHCFALGGADLTRAAGKMTMSVVLAVAEFERDLLVERTAAGLARARDAGKVLGRPRALSDKQEAQARERIAQEQSIASIARALNTSRQTVMRVRTHSEQLTTNLYLHPRLCNRLQAPGTIGCPTEIRTDTEQECAYR